ncbi:hypothetical protein OG730_04465 [Streptomyces sp. NBC_01298]|uniref:hypothetical protein n=1 Tax=Streptomyces sp. NBC_01298 TaxID=2903817 RepID=UPI002E0F8CB5|nr:hypothetical protein OG730_04465 [Streptomyces sp. NBC_01298]
MAPVEVDAAEAWRAHVQECTEWQDARTSACRAAANAAALAYRRDRNVFIPGELYGARVAGRRRGGEAFERRTARPEFNGQRKTVALLYVTPEQEGVTPDGHCLSGASMEGIGPERYAMHHAEDCSADPRRLAQLSRDNPPGPAAA